VPTLPKSSIQARATEAADTAVQRIASESTTPAGELPGAIGVLSPELKQALKRAWLQGYREGRADRTKEISG
jgi:hypothetical protein